jgi:hypothetical protein
LLFKDAGQNVDVILPDDTVVTLRTLLELIYTGKTLAQDSILLKKIDTLSKVVGFPFKKLVISNVPYTVPLVELEELDTHNENDDIESVHDGFGIDYVDDETNWLEGTTNIDQEYSTEDNPALVDEYMFEVNVNPQVCIPTEDHTSDTMPLSSNINIDSPSNMDSVFKETKCRLCQKTFQCPSMVIQHLSTVHYITEIRDNFGQHYNLKTKRCQLCQRSISNMQSFITHIGGVHKISLDYYKMEPEIDFMEPEIGGVPINNDQNFSPEGSIDGTDQDMSSVTNMGSTYHKVFDYLDNENATDAASAECMPSQEKVLDQPLMMKEQSQPKVYGSAKSHVCHYCKKKMSNTSLILQHLSVVHFGDRLMAKYGKTFEIDKTCQLCGKKMSFNTITAFLWHIGSTHGKALDLLKEDGISHNIVKTMRGQKKKKMRGQTNSVGPHNIIKSKRGIRNKRNKQTNGEKQVLEQSQTQPGYTGSAQSHECHYCGVTMSCATYILNHLSVNHFRDRLMTKFGQTFDVDKTCQLCGKVMQNNQVVPFLCHIGSTHGKALDILKEDGISHNIVKNKKGQTNKRNKQTNGKKQVLDQSQTQHETNALPAAKGSEVANSGALACPACFIILPKANLQTHISHQHYQRQLWGKYEKDYQNGRCQLCDKEISSKQSFIRHIGITHRKVLIFVPPPKRSAYIRCLPIIRSPTIIPSINISGDRSEETGSLYRPQVEGQDVEEGQGGEAATEVDDASSFANSTIEPQPVQVEDSPMPLEEPLEPILVTF